MDISFSNIVSTSDIQKNYRKIFDRVKKTRKPIVVMKGKKPEVVVMNVKVLDELNKKIEEAELADALRAIEEGERELQEGKTKVVNSLADLF